MLADTMAFSVDKKQCILYHHFQSAKPSNTLNPCSGRGCKWVDGKWPSSSCNVGSKALMVAVLTIIEAIEGQHRSQARMSREIIMVVSDLSLYLSMNGVLVQFYIHCACILVQTFGHSTIILQVQNGNLFSLYCRCRDDSIQAREGTPNMTM